MDVRESMHKASLQLQNKVDYLHEYDSSLLQVCHLCVQAKYKLVTELCLQADREAAE